MIIEICNEFTKCLQEFMLIKLSSCFNDLNYPPK